MTSRPPNYVNVPAAVAYAPVPDALVVTMLRILGLCWTNRYRHTPPLTTGELTRLLDRPRSTLQRHLDLLEQELGWLRREHRDGRFVLHPCPPFSAHPVPEDPDPSPGTSVAVEASGTARSIAPGTSVVGQALGTARSTTPGAFVVAGPAGNGHGSAKSASGAPHTFVAGENGKSRNGSGHTALAPNVIASRILLRQSNPQPARRTWAPRARYG